jgi:hypothetical protein
VKKRVAVAALDDAPDLERINCIGGAAQLAVVCPGLAKLRVAPGEEMAL